MSIKKIKVEENEVEVLNSIENKKPKITKIKADDNSSSYSSNTSHQAGGNPFEKMFEEMKNNAGGEMNNNPMMKMMGNIGEIKKIKPYFFFSIVCGIIALFALREYLGVAAIFFGALDLWKGSSLTKTASYFGIFLGLIALILYFK